MSAARRPQAPRLARPAARYWKGKAPKGAAAVADDSDEDEDADAAPDAPADEGAVSVSGEQAFAGAGEDGDEDEDEDGGLARPAQAPRRGLNVALRDVNISRDGRVVVAGREESGRTAAEAGASCARSGARRCSRSSGRRGERGGRGGRCCIRGRRGARCDMTLDLMFTLFARSLARKSQSRKMRKSQSSCSVLYSYQSTCRLSLARDPSPKDERRRARVTVAEREAEAQDTEDALKRKEAAVAERKQQSHDMVAETIRRELAESACLTASFPVFSC
jgi:microfibrillar-associated protein 1